MSDLLLRTAPRNRSSELLGCPLIQIGPRRQKATIQRKSRRVQFLMFQRPNTGRLGARKTPGVLLTEPSFVGDEKKPWVRRKMDGRFIRKIDPKPRHRRRL